MVQELIKHGTFAVICKEQTIHIKPDPKLSLGLLQVHTIGPFSCHSVSQKVEDTNICKIHNLFHNITLQRQCYTTMIMKESDARFSPCLSREQQGIRVEDY